MYVTMRVGTLVRLIAAVALVSVVVFVLLTRSVQESPPKSADEARASCVVICAGQVNID